MKAIVISGMSALMLIVGASAMADNANWSAEKAAQVAQNRCTNAGKGGEGVFGVTCVQAPDFPESHPFDQDPGKSGKNANNRK